MSDLYTQHTLSNGLHIVIEQMPDVRSAAAGFLVRTGARDEPPELAGVSHFLEHMMFKGTRKRGWREITVDFDRMGSSYNAFTSQDRTVYYGWVRAGDIGAQIELLADMLRSTLPPEEFEMEKNVILEEIAMSKDSLEHTAVDFLQEKVFAGSSLAWPVLGYDETVRGLSRERMWAYFEQRYTPDRMALVVTGNVDPRAVIGYAEEHCGDWGPSGAEWPRAAPVIRGGVDVRVVERFRQQCVALTFPAVGERDGLAETAATVAAILGGENSRFYWNIVQTGISSRTGAHYLGFTDCGVLLLYGLCPPEKCEALLEALRREARRLMSEPAADYELNRIKTRRRTSLAVESEAPYQRLTQLMDDLEYHGAPRTVEQMLAEVDAVNQERIGEYLRRCPIDDGGHLCSVGPRDWPAGGGGG